MLLDLVKRGESVLFLGKPGSGKTHTLRDFVARLSDTGNNVMIVDTSNEVGGPGDVKHFSLHKARRLQVRDRSRQFEVLLEAVQNHTPDIVCIDEISDAKEVAAARSVATRVQAMVATAHGDLESILRNSVMRDLVGGLQTATVGDARAKELGGRKNVTTRARDSLFTTVVELVSRTEVRVFRNVNQVVDDILHPRGFPWAERRWLAVPTDSVRRRRAKSRGCKAKEKDHGDGEAEANDGNGGGEGGGGGGTQNVGQPKKLKNQGHRAPRFFMARLEPFQKPDLELPAA
ncbi:hypothetical protein BCR44DRAFT_59117 [Catenaria anguillulae PL171]|uniref:AAA+ ATPase domain-containing protein n=1 Tax=Catenaria anguillulae PL171 TaxID=765915 RepID=A0A1Y2HNC4_9FUNG|nr:hypothetical protein BCR44DRAFT_59117 [Catenaria anguillulae PL171]